MLFRCNILAIVGGGAAPKYPPNKVMIWDDHQGKCIGELSFRSQVRAVRLRRDRIVVALEHKVLVYNFADLKLLNQIETLANTKGLVAVSSSAESTVLACPGLHTGQVRIELYDRKQTKFISAHNTALACLTLSMDGKRLATASDKGTLIRVWNTADGQLLQELRRGTEPAHIYSIAMSPNCDWLAVSSDKGTVHVFSLANNVQTMASDKVEAATNSANPMLNGGPASPTALPGGSDGASTSGPRHNPTSVFSMVKGFVPGIPLPKYFASEWSFAQYRISDENAGRVIVGFVPTAAHTLVLITQGGTYHKITFDPAKAGNCVQQFYGNYINKDSDE
eukprot:jgi/Chrzof1/803/Cz01g29120.t1